MFAYHLFEALLWLTLLSWSLYILDICFQDVFTADETFWDRFAARFEWLHVIAIILGTSFLSGRAVYLSGPGSREAFWVWVPTVVLAILGGFAGLVSVFAIAFRDGLGGEDFGPP